MSASQRARRALGNLVTHVVKRGIVARSYFSDAVQKVQASMLDDDDVDDMPVYGPQGVSFRTPVDAEVMVIHPMGDPDQPSCIGTDQRGARPTEKPGGGEVPEGAGGLHFLGSWRVYLSDDGVVYLGGAESSDEFVALATKVLNELNDIRTKFDAHIHVTTATVGATATAGVIAPPSPGMGAAGSVAATATKAK